jgi:dihydroxy-acid dehydratase
VSPEAAEGGPVALVKDGDRILVDIPRRKVDLLVPADELEKRRKAWRKPAAKQARGILARYARLVKSAGTRAVLGD